MKRQQQPHRREFDIQPRLVQVAIGGDENDPTENRQNHCRIGKTSEQPTTVHHPKGRRFAIGGEDQALRRRDQPAAPPDRRDDVQSLDLNVKFVM